MSTTTTQSVRWAWERAIRDDGNLSRSAKLLAFTLATYMSPNGKCRPSKARLTRDLCFTSHESLEKPRSELRKAGYLAVTRHLSRPTEYRAITPNRLDSRPIEASTATTDIASLLSQPVRSPVSQPVGLRTRTDQRATDQKPKDLRAFEGDELGVSFDDEKLLDGKVLTEVLTPSVQSRTTDFSSTAALLSSEALPNEATYPYVANCYRGSDESMPRYTIRSAEHEARERAVGWRLEPLPA